LREARNTTIPVIDSPTACQPRRFRLQWENEKQSVQRRVARREEWGDAILDLCLDQRRLEATPVNEFLNLFVI
jgi:hypothetical protein